ncbi:MAG: alpha/beta hydrolase [Patescibacteria group bacterium]
MPSEIRGYTHIHKPPSDGNPYTFLTLHGTGGTEQDLVEVVENIDQTAGILSPRGTVIDGGQSRFFKRPQGEKFDEADIALHAKELVLFVNEATQQYNLDRNNLIWLGYSNGANMVSSIMFLHPEVIQKAILLRPMVVLSPSRIPTLPEAVVLMASGRQDPIVAEDTTQKLIHMLQQTGAIVELYLHEGGHHLEDGDTEVARNWYMKHTGRTPQVTEQPFEEEPAETITKEADEDIEQEHLKQPDTVNRVTSQEDHSENKTEHYAI